LADSRAAYRKFDFCPGDNYISWMDAEKFHQHYRLQAEWLARSRHYLYRRADLARRRHILDLGCGSGVISEEMREICGRAVLGVDHDPQLVDFAREKYPQNHFMVADEKGLIRRGLSFDLVVLSFVLLWQARPLLFLKRVRKLLPAHGILLVLAEPDYGGRIDFPAALNFLKDIFIGHIRQEGGDPFIGRHLASLLQKAGFRAAVDMASCLNSPRYYSRDTWEGEWRFWQELAGLSAATVEKILRLEMSAAANNERQVLFPVYCAVARPL
jgi:SAM-dependent methyltransferase